MSQETPQSIREDVLEDSGRFPNNQQLPVLFYTSAFAVDSSDLADQMERRFRRNNWTNAWRNGIFSYHHYHSTAHEVLGVYRGTVQVQLGGPKGITLEATTGDVLILPAGTAHKNLGSTDVFRCIGAYPSGQDWDMNYGEEDERPASDKNINQVSLPENDPVYGSGGPLVEKWKRS